MTCSRFNAHKGKKMDRFWSWLLLICLIALPAYGLLTERGIHQAFAGVFCVGVALYGVTQAWRPARRYETRAVVAWFCVIGVVLSYDAITTTDPIGRAFMVLCLLFALYVLYGVVSRGTTRRQRTLA